ncbi:MAG: PKD domain-containing protein, partial [Saprospiraceae bacterium]
SGYMINWGDGSPIQNYTNAQFTSSIPVSHTYTILGYSPITIQATYVNGCVMKSTYQFFHGGNPDIGIANIGNTSGLCAPTSVAFNITAYQNNPPGTVYTFYENNVQVGPTYTQSNLPNPFIYNHSFTKSSCGEQTPDGQYKNAFSIKVVAKNPCGEKAGSIQPITLSTKPVVDFSVSPPPKLCPGETFAFMNTSSNINEYNSQTQKCDTLVANWLIKPGTVNVDYTIVGGNLFNNNKLEVKFITPGTYKVSMWLNPEPVCGPDTVTKTINILEPPKAKVTTTLSNPNGCAPLTVKFNNQSTGYMLSHNWQITPATGWQFLNGGNTSTISPDILFNAIGTYTVKYTVSNVCSTDTWTTTVTVKAKPAIVLPMLGPYCQTAALCFTAANTTFDAGNGTINSYAWSFSGGSPSSSTSQYPCTINYNVSTATTFTVSVTATNECGSTTGTTTFDVQVPPLLTMPANLTLCIDAPAKQLTALPPGGNWTGTGVSSTGLFTPSNAGGIGIKNLTYKYGSGVCEATGTMQISVVGLPNVAAGPDLKSCINETAINLTGATPAGGTWTSSGTGVIVGNIFNPM